MFLSFFEMENFVLFLSCRSSSASSTRDFGFAARLSLGLVLSICVCY